MELQGNLMQILFDSKGTQKNEATIFGFTVVKLWELDSVSIA